MGFPTLSLCLIVKNEEKNINRLLDSVEGCIDEIIVVDTGSTDRTREIAELRGCKVYDFEWVDDFSKARNFSFSKATQDYVLWLDGDDVLSSKEFFMKWKQTSMQFADIWFNTYHYAFDAAGVPIVSFARERVIKRSLNAQWNYALHEGLTIDEKAPRDVALSWTVNHMRDAADMVQDRSRNLRIIEKMKAEGKLDSRMQFYYGKELFEAGKAHESLHEFDKALEMGCGGHDKILALQYANYSCQGLGDMVKDEHKAQKDAYFRKAIDYALKGIQEDPTRAEFFVGIGDCYLKMGNPIQALPFYAAAKNCLTPMTMGLNTVSPLYYFKDCYGQAPLLQMAKIYLSVNQLEEGGKYAQECFDKYQNPDAKNLVDQLGLIQHLTRLDNNQEQTEEIVISCPPGQAYPFDEVAYGTKGMGGSETALIEMAKWLKLKTGRRVIVFNTRDEDLIAPSGVEYLSNVNLNEYFSKFKPKMHIAWRHNIKMTTAPTYLWCHDLVTGGVENNHAFDKIMCLSQFHKDYVMGKQGVPEEKIWVTRNGLSPEKFAFKKPDKDPNKIVWLSSPDRGLDRAMIIMDEVRKTYPDVKLHVYYGLDNLAKYGLKELAERLQKMMDDRSDYVIYHGFTEQKKMAKDIADAAIWLHPCNFIETFCITALETLALSIFPITRRLGALGNTLSEPAARGQAILLDHDALEPEHIRAYAKEVNRVIEGKLWENISFEVNRHSWESVANQWIGEMGIESHSIS